MSKALIVLVLCTLSSSKTLYAQSTDPVHFTACCRYLIVSKIQWSTNMQTRGLHSKVCLVHPSCKARWYDPWVTRLMFDLVQPHLATSKYSCSLHSVCRYKTTSQQIKRSGKHFCNWRPETKHILDIFGHIRKSWLVLFQHRGKNKRVNWNLPTSFPLWNVFC